MSRTDKFNEIIDLARFLFVTGTTMTLAQLAAWLNQRGIRTSYGTPYRPGGRGVARLAGAAYRYAHDELGLGAAGAEPIAKAFTTQNGDYAYD